MKLIVKKYTLSVCMLFVFGIAHGAAIQAAENGLAGEDTQTAAELGEREVDKFQYQFEGRPDPFLPFLQEKRGRDENEDTPIDEEGGGPLTGMQLIEPGQLRLVAVLKVGNSNVAMAEDAEGKGYRLDENMLIGRYGTINRITSEQVQITETYKTKTGRVVSKEIIMRLKKERDD